MGGALVIRKLFFLLMMFIFRELLPPVLLTQFASEICCSLLELLNLLQSVWLLLLLSKADGLIG